MFDGRKEHTVDTKGRVSVPERFRTVFADEDRQEVILSWSWSPGRLCIAAWTPSHWQDFLNKIANEPLSDERIEYVHDIVLSTKEVCPLDANGRILIPQHLREFAGLSNRALFVGRVKLFEIWDPERHSDLVKLHRKNSAIRLSSLGL